MKKLLTTLLLGLACSLNVQAKELKVVVATNFQGTLQTLAKMFEDKTGHSISGVSAGPAYAQIVNGGPRMKAPPDSLRSFPPKGEVTSFGTAVRN